MFTGGTEASVLSSQLHIFPSDHQVALCLQVEHQVALCLQVEQRLPCSVPVFLLTTRWHCVYRWNRGFCAQFTAPQLSFWPPGGTAFTGGTPGGTVFTGGTEGSVLSSKPYIFPSDHQVALCLQVEQRLPCSVLSSIAFLLTTRWHCVDQLNARWWGSLIQHSNNYDMPHLVAADVSSSTTMLH